MSSVDYAESFVDDMLKVELDSKREEIFYEIEILETAPEIGSKILPDSVKLLYGEDVRKLVVDSFDVVYRYIPEEDTVRIMGLLHQREAR